MPSLQERAAAELELRKRTVGNSLLAQPCWTPQPGTPQERAYHSDADIIGFGGGAGGGKTDLLLGFAGTKHRRSIIFRRVFPSLRAIVERSREIFNSADRPHSKDSYNESLHVWRLQDGVISRTIELGAVQYESDRRKHQGQPRDFYGFDEATEFPESLVRFLIGWNRTTTPGQKCRVVMTFNPPMDEAGEWIVAFFAPWLDPEHHNPAADGELRWFAMVDGKELEVGPEPFEHNGELITPKSRTFFHAKLSDNPILAATGYGATIDAMPEPIRSLLKGNFGAARIGDPWQLIPVAWVKAANRRWEMRTAPGDTELTMSGLDVSHGGPDKTVLARRYDDYIAALDVWPGSEITTGMAAAQRVARILPAGAIVNVDAIGYGASAAERLADQPPEGFGMAAIPVNVGERSEHRDKSGRFRMFNLRAEMYWRLRDALDPENGGTFALPPDPEILADLCAPRYEITPSGIKVESKEDIQKRLPGNRSPDKGDAVALTMLPDRTPVRRKSRMS